MVRFPDAAGPVGPPGRSATARPRDCLRRPRWWPARRTQCGTIWWIRNGSAPPGPTSPGCGAVVVAGGDAAGGALAARVPARYSGSHASPLSCPRDPTRWSTSRPPANGITTRPPEIICCRAKAFTGPHPNARQVARRHVVPGARYVRLELGGHQPYPIGPGRLPFGSLLTTYAYDASIASRNSSSEIRDPSTNVFHPCRPIYEDRVTSCGY